MYPSKTESLSMLVGNFVSRLIIRRSLWCWADFIGWWLWRAGSCLSTSTTLHRFCFLRVSGDIEGGGAKTLLVSAANVLLHCLGVAATADIVSRVNARFVDLEAWPRLSFCLYGAEMIVVGGVIAGTLFGVYLYVTSRWLNMNHNDAFSSMRRDTHRHFLRLRIQDDKVTVFLCGRIGVLMKQILAPRLQPTFPYLLWPRI